MGTVAESRNVAVQDVKVLRIAARVLRLRSTRPRSITVGVICNVLNSTADKIEREMAR